MTLHRPLMAMCGSSVSSAMVGRERELEVGTRWLASLERDSGCMILEGEAGIGKTTLWSAIVAQAEARGCRVMWCRPAAAEATMSFSGLADLMAGVDRSALAGLPDPQRHALEVALLEALPGPQRLQQRAVFAGFTSVVSRLAADAVVLVAVDDLHWLDLPSQAALEFALRRLGGRPIGFLGSVRIEESRGLTVGLRRALREEAAKRLSLVPLSVGALHELLVAKLGRNLARPTVVRIAAATGGNPFYAQEVTREMERRGAASPGGALPVPDDLSELVAVRVARLPRATREALLVLAALSSPRLDLVDRADLVPAEEAGLVDVAGEEVAFSHPLFAAAVYGSASIPARRRLHRRLASLLNDPEERARHLALGAEQASEEIATELESAAERSVARGAPDAAAELLELAVRITPSADGRGPLRALGAAECRFHAGDRSRARSLAEGALTDAQADPIRGRALQLLGEIRYHEDSFRESVPLFEEALTLQGDDPRSVELHVNLAFARWNLGDMAGAAAHGEAAAEAATTVGADGLPASAMAVSAMAEFYLDRPLDRARIESALALEDSAQQVVIAMRPSLIAGVVAFFSDDLDRATTLLEGLRRRTRDQGDDSGLPHLDVDLSMVERSRGNLPRALEYANEACEIARMFGSATGQALALAERCYVRATAGDVEPARQDAELVEGMARQTDVGYAAGWVRSASAFLELSMGNAKAACEWLELLLTAIERSGSFNPTAVTFGLPDAIEALVALGELDRAEALTVMLQRHGRAHDRPSALARGARCHALLNAARGELAAARSEIDQALEHHARVAMPLERGRTLLVKGLIERRGRQKRAARETIQDALEHFESTGARLWADRARADLERTGVRHSEGDALTPSELRVAELAAAGLTNKRIAETAFISAKTVEANLASVYLKLGIRSRAELGRVMAERSAGSSVSK
jgi:DNA-binding NarL/FixJ family response regulator